MPIDAPGSVCGGQGADSAQIGRETDVALAMALIQTPFHTAWALSDGSHFHGRRSLWVRSGRHKQEYSAATWPAITAWAAKFWTNAICLSAKG